MCGVDERLIWIIEGSLVMQSCEMIKLTFMAASSRQTILPQGCIESVDGMSQATGSTACCHVQNLGKAADRRFDRIPSI